MWILETAYRAVVVDMSDYLRGLTEVDHNPRPPRWLCHVFWRVLLQLYHVPTVAQPLESLKGIFPSKPVRSRLHLRVSGHSPTCVSFFG